METDWLMTLLIIMLAIQIGVNRSKIDELEKKIKKQKGGKI